MTGVVGVVTAHAQWTHKCRYRAARIRHHGRVDKLPQGWSRPIKGSEVTLLFPWVGSVTWNGRPQGWQSADALPVVWLEWSPRSAQTQPVLTLWAVPSQIRSLVRQAVHDQVRVEAAEWFAKITSTEVLRAAHHMTQWLWTEQGLSRDKVKTERPRGR
jgi:hypothetical protein